MKHFVFRLTVLIVTASVITLPSMAQYSSNQSTGSDSAFIKNAMESNYAEVVLGRLAESKAQDPQVKDFGSMMVRDHREALERMHNMMNSSTGMDANMNMSMENMGNPEDCGQISASSRQTNENNRMQIQLSPAAQQVCNRLSNLSGTAFDREYINTMVQDHRSDVREFEREAGITPSGSNQSDTNREKPGDPTDINNEPGGISSSGSMIDSKSFAREMLPALQRHLQTAEQLQRQLK
jgi:putative membrane protein